MKFTGDSTDKMHQNSKQECPEKQRVTFTLWFSTLKVGAKLFYPTRFMG